MPGLSGKSGEKLSAGEGAGLSAEALLARLGECMARDRPRLRRALQGLRRGRGRSAVPTRLVQAFESSQAQAESRRGRVPAITYPPGLPITAALDRIAEAVAGHAVTVVCGETGSGKTTQLPKLGLALGRGVAGVIGHTQPRRLAARSVAGRIAAELGPAGPLLVGDTVRFTDRTRPETAVKLMTDGILLAEVPSDPDLLAYDMLIVDEAHERSLNIDFLLGYLKRLLPRRPDLKVVITSATIDPERFSRHFGGAPVVEVAGRSHPVEVRYRPLPGRDEDERDSGLDQAIVDAVGELAREGPGDVLVFLPGEREIREAAEAVRKHHPAATEVLPLYARLSSAEQERVFQPAGRRRVVLATNVAETSLTVPGVRYVVDTGLARVTRYSHRTKVQRLPVEKVSQASAEQRKGRCGRLGPGVCVRLYDAVDFELRPRFTDPEIRRANLAGVILRMEALGLGAIDRFPFVDPPDPRYVNDGYRLLAEIGAVDRQRRLTPLGRELARLPLDPRLARMLLAARDEGSLAEVLIVVSALAVQDPRERPVSAREAADAAHREFQDPRSDFLALIKLWGFYHEQARHLTRSKLRQLCRERFLSYVRMREWHDTHQQLLALLHDMGLRVSAAPADYAAVHRALLAGLLGHLGLKREDGAYRGPRGTVLHLFPGSGLAGRGPRWVMAAELVETSRLFARTVATVEPEWVEPLAAHLVRRHHSEPWWDAKRGEVLALEDVTLYGLPIVSRRTVRFGTVEPERAREVFIRGALIAGEYRVDAPFLLHNRALWEEVARLEHKARRQDILVDEATLFRFYDARVPQGVTGQRELEAWRRQAEAEDPRCLFLTRAELMRHGAEGLGPERFPDVLEAEGLHLALEYRFEPGHEADGVTVRVPVAVLGRLDPARLEWLVPGLLAERLTELLRGLPRALRRHFIPAAELARACAEALGSPRGLLGAALSRELERMTGVAVPVEAWRAEALPDHLRMRVEVVDAEGRVLGSGRDLRRLQAGLGEVVRARLETADWPGVPREPARRWAFGEIPERLETVVDGMPTVGYPALWDDGSAVRVRVLQSREEAALAHRAGLLRLFALDLAPQLADLQRRLPGVDRLCLLYATLPPAPWGAGPASDEPACAELRRHLVEATLRRCFLAPGAAIRTEAEYAARRKAGQAGLASVAGELARLVGEVLGLARELEARLGSSATAEVAPIRADVRRQLGWLVYRGFVEATPERWLPHLPRYLRAALHRLERASRDPARDQRGRQALERLRADCEAALRAHGVPGRWPVGLEELRWLLEELRVSLFAQGLKTAVPVSVQRLERRWAELVAQLNALGASGLGQAPPAN